MSYSLPTLPLDQDDAAVPRRQRVVTGRLLPAGLAAAVVAIVANGLLRLIARGPLDVSPAFEPLRWGSVIAASIVGIAGATVVLAILARTSSRPIRLFTIVAAVVLVLSLGGPLSMRSEPGGSTSAVLVLAAMHVVTAAIAVGFLTTLTQQR
ncbi:MAG: DUF6069 family protein [Chloroflexota bacterium]|nr:DUF6069 family protein [Chloroflexota bacterium]